MSIIPRFLCHVKKTRIFLQLNNKKVLFCNVVIKRVYCKGGVITKKIYEAIDDTFLYYAYGSNLLKKRISINIASAKFLGIGKLKNYQLDFIKYSDTWCGAAATIIPKKNAHLWGAIWRLNVSDIPALDKQEGVSTNWYFSKMVDVISSPDSYKVQCRTYQQELSPPLLKLHQELPMKRRPSITYMKVIINGAKECKLPGSYVEELKKIPHNGQKASPKMIESLGESYK